VFMQKRPPTGIWGGLWCFPQFETKDEVIAWLDRQQIDALTTRKIAKFTHVFSHFRLHIQPLIMQLESPLKESVMEDDQNLWYNLDTEFEGGLATPVQKLLQEIKS